LKCFTGKIYAGTANIPVMVGYTRGRQTNRRKLERRRRIITGSGIPAPAVMMTIKQLINQQKCAKNTVRDY